MNCMKNPRLKYRKPVEYASRAMELNLSHMGIMLYCLRTIAPSDFSAEKCRAFVGEYADTVNEYDDEEERDYMIERELKRSPWLSWDIAHKLIDRFAKRAETPLDKAIYANEGFKPLFALNLLMMFIQLRVDHQFGRIRMKRLYEAMMMMDYPEPIKWLEGINVMMSPNDDSAYELVQKMHKTDKPIATLREQLDARRQLEALKAYQEGKHDKTV